MRWVFDKSLSDVVLPFYWSSFFEYWHKKSNNTLAGATHTKTVGIFLVSGDATPLPQTNKKIGILLSTKDILPEKISSYDLIIGPWTPDEIKDFPEFLSQKYFFLPPVYDVETSSTKKEKTIAFLSDPRAASKDPILSYSFPVFKRLKWFSFYDIHDFEDWLLPKVITEIAPKKAVISAIEDPVLNHAIACLCRKFKTAFVLWGDDGSSPLRYCEADKKCWHPLLKDFDDGRLKLYSYGPFAQKIRRVLHQAKQEEIFGELLETPEHILARIENCLTHKINFYTTCRNIKCEAFSDPEAASLVSRQNNLISSKFDEPQFYFPLKTFGSNPQSLNTLIKTILNEKEENRANLYPLLNAWIINYLPYESWRHFFKIFSSSIKEWLSSMHHSILFFFNYANGHTLLFEWNKIQFHAGLTWAEGLSAENLNTVRAQFELSAEFEHNVLQRHPTLSKALLFISQKQFDAAVAYVKEQTAKHGNAQGLGDKIAKEIWTTLSHLYPKIEESDRTSYAQTGLALLQADADAQAVDLKTYHYLKALFHMVLKEDAQLEEICMTPWNPLRTCGHASKLASELLRHDKKYAPLADQLLKYDA